MSETKRHFTRALELVTLIEMSDGEFMHEPYLTAAEDILSDLLPQDGEDVGAAYVRFVIYGLAAASLTHMVVEEAAEGIEATVPAYLETVLGCVIARMPD